MFSNKEINSQFQENRYNYNHELHESISEAVITLNPKILSAMGKLLYEHVMTQIAEDRYCIKTNQTIAKEFGINAHTVSNNLSRCNKLGLFTIKYSHSHKNGHRIIYMTQKNWDKLHSMDAKLRAKLHLHKAKEYEQTQDYKPSYQYKSNKHPQPVRSVKPERLTTKQNKIIQEIAKKVTKVDPAYQAVTVRRTIRNEHQRRNVQLKKLPLALKIVKGIWYHNASKIRSFVGLMCYLTKLSVATLKKKCLPAGQSIVTHQQIENGKADEKHQIDMLMEADQGKIKAQFPW